MIAALSERARRDVDDGLLPSCQLALAREGDVFHFETIGDATDDSRYLIWSCTKALVASAVWLLIGDSLLDLDATVASYVPEFATNGKDKVTIDQVLLHTAGFPHAPFGPIDWQSRESRLDRFRRWRLNWPPGSRYEYHSFSAHWVLAELIDRLAGTDYREFVRARITESLGLHPGLQLGVPEGEQSDIVAVVPVGTRPTTAEYESVGWKVPPPPAPGTDAAGAAILMNTPAAREVGIPAAGAVGRAAELALFYQALLHNPDELWRPDVLADATRRVRCTLPDAGKNDVACNRTRGLVIAGDDGHSRFRMGMGSRVSPRTFGHDGAGGQIAWADPDTGLSFAYLTNGMDANNVRQLVRTDDLSSLAAAC